MGGPSNATQRDESSKELEHVLNLNQSGKKTLKRKSCTPASTAKSSPPKIPPDSQPVSTEIVFDITELNFTVNDFEASTTDADDDTVTIENDNDHSLDTEQEDVQQVTQRNCAVFTLKEPVFKVPPIKNLDDIFIFSSWKLTKNRMKLQELEQWRFGDKVLKFLRGETLDWTVEEIIEFLNGSPRKYIGGFPSSFIILDFCVRNTCTHVFDLFERSHGLELCFKDLIEKLAIYIGQRKVRQDITTPPASNIIPKNIQSNLKFDFIPLAAHFGSETSHILTTTEAKFLSRVTASITDLVFGDIKCNDISLMDGCFSVVERAHHWITLLHDFMNGWIKYEECNVLSLVLQSNLQKFDGTRPYFKINWEGQQTPVHLHEAIVKRFSDSIQADLPLIDANPADVEALKKLLYHNHKPSYYKGLVTFGLYRIVSTLKFRNLEWFLFRENDYTVYTDNHNKPDILKILIKLRKNDHVKAIASKLSNWMPENQMGKCLNGLSAEDVIYFLDQKKLDVDELTVYKITLEWAHEKNNKKCDDVMKAEFDSKVNESFQTVRKVLRISQLECHAHLFCENRYVSIYDICVAAQLKNTKNKM